MAYLKPSYLLHGLTLAIAIQAFAFIVFHLNRAQLFDIRFVRAALERDWMFELNWWVYLGILYLPAIALIWLAVRKHISVPLALLLVMFTVFSAWYWQYPLLTGILFSLEQFGSYPDFLFENMPGIDQYPDL